MKTESKKNKMLTLVGKGVSPGLSKGKAFVYIVSGRKLVFFGTG